MKTFLILSLFLIGGHAQAANLPAASSYAGGFTASPNTVANSPLSVPLSGLATAGIYMLCGGGTPTANQYFGLYSPKGRVDSSTFPLGTGKTLRGITATLISAAAAGSIFNIGYGTGVLSAENTATAPAGNVRIFGSATSGGSPFNNWLTTYAPMSFSILGLDLYNHTAGNLYMWVSTTGTSAFNFCLQALIQ